MISIRLLLLAIVSVAGLAIAFSFNDIVRYLKMRSM